MPARSGRLIGTAAIGLAFAASIGALFSLLGEPTDARQLTDSLYDYASAAGLEIQLGILVDPLSVFMCLVVTGVSTLIHLYSVAYMDSDRGYARFFSYLNFFVFSMLLLVLAGNFVFLIVGWAFVGFASYALISFWYRRETATKAGMKAFVINVVGDIGLVLAALVRSSASSAPSTSCGAFDAARETFTTNQGVVVAICLLLCVGAFAKSAQVPLHTWLPDAMEGPTPVSALIHAATMVTAGVYLIARMFPLFELAPTAADIAAFVGLATLLIAATIALVGHRPEADHRLLDDEPDRLHDRRRLDRRLRRRALSPDGPRLLQGAAVHGRRLGDRGDGQQPEHRPDGRLPARAAVHLRPADRRLPGPRRLPRHLRLLLQGRDPRLRAPSAAGCTGSSRSAATSARS